jgi:RHS repeat-associated protein
MDAGGNPVAGVVFGANGLLVYGTSGYQFDPQGNAAHLMDDDGLVLAHLAYDAWGQRMSGNNPTPYGYKGQWGYYTDGETGILLLTHRYFDPATGRFLTRDPIGFEGGVNLYAYVGNGVVMLKDPVGLKNDTLNRIWKCARDCYLKSDASEFEKCFRDCMGKEFTKDLCVAYGCFLPWAWMPHTGYTGCPPYGNPCSPHNDYPRPRGQGQDCADLKYACCMLFVKNMLDVRKCQIEHQRDCMKVNQ